MTNEPFRPEMPAAVMMPPERPLMRWSRVLLYAALAAALLLASSAAWFPLASGKLALFSSLIFLGALAAVFGGAGFTLARARGRVEILLLALLPVVYLISAWKSVDRSIAFVGTGSETDTVLFVMLAFAAAALAFIVVRGVPHLRGILLLASGVAALALLLQYVSVLIGLPGDVFADKSANLIGKWNDFGILVGLLALLLVGALELLSLGKRAAIAAWVVLVLSLLMLGVVYFNLVWWMLLVASAAVALVRHFFGAGAEAAGASRRIPFAAGLTALVAVAFLVFGASLNASLSSVFKVASLEVRPALSSTIDIGKAAHDSAFRSLFGSGPNTFDEAWLSYKPVEVNQTQFWSVDFATGFSLLSTAFVSVGYLGMIAWLIPLLLILLALWRLSRINALSHTGRTLGFMAGAGAAYLWIATVFYTPSPNILFLSFALTGALLGYLSAHRNDGAGMEPSRTSRMVWSAALIILMLVAAWGALASDRRFLSYFYSQRAVVAAQGGDLAAGEALLSRSLAIEQNGNNLRLGVQMSLARMIAIAQSTTTPAVDAQAQFTAALQEAVASGQAAIALNPKDYRPYLELAAVYDFLRTLKIEGAAESEMAAYQMAQALNQKNPAIPFFRAQLEAGSPQGSATAVETYLTQSLQLKSNYTDALLFAVQLAVAQNNLTTALQAQSAAVSSAPDQAPLWYQLGLLYYVGGDMTNATAALEKALSITPNYANAQYFLGLSYYRQQKTPDAITQFTALAASNPDNTDVAKMLLNLQAGKDPLAGIATSTPGSVPKK